MSIIVPCPHCSKRALILAGSTGRQVRCPHCNEPFTAPQGGEPLPPQSVVVSARNLLWPQKCPCCGCKPCDTWVSLSHTKKVRGKQVSRGWSLPYCPRCLQHATEARRAFVAGESLEKAKALMAPTCCKLEMAVSYEGWFGAKHTFLFYSPGYANSFIQANEEKCLGRALPAGT